MKCIDCPYHWADCDDNGVPVNNAYCHYQYDDGYAPCEVDDYEDEGGEDDEY